MQSNLCYVSSTWQEGFLNPEHDYNQNSNNYAKGKEYFLLRCYKIDTLIGIPYYSLKSTRQTRLAKQSIGQVGNEKIQSNRQKTK